MTASASVQGNKSKHTRGFKNENFLIWTRQNKVHIFGKFCLQQSKGKEWTFGDAPYTITSGGSLSH